MGINATRALTTKYDAQLSLGRVQTPTIQLVYHRQQKLIILNLKSITHFL